MRDQHPSAVSAVRINIEAADIEKLPCLLSLLSEAEIWLSNRGIQQWEPGLHRRIEGTLKKRASRGLLVVAQDAGRVVGGCILSDEPPQEWLPFASRSLYVHQLVVALSHRGRCVGCDLLKWCADHASNRKYVALRLDCWAQNLRLRQVYREAGFFEIGIVCGTRDTCLLERELAPGDKAK